MKDWIDAVSAIRALSADAAQELNQSGFTVIPDAMTSAGLERLGLAYDRAMSSAPSTDLKVGSTTTRLGDFVNGGEVVDGLYIFPPLLEACCRVIGRPFKLSSLNARTLKPRSLNGKLHVDVQRDSAEWPLVGFILMVDEFRAENGATRFVPGSHRWLHPPEPQFSEARNDHAEQVQACGRAGSLLIFNGSTWHDHATERPREICARDLMGARKSAHSTDASGEITRPLRGLALRRIGVSTSTRCV